MYPDVSFSLIATALRIILFAHRLLFCVAHSRILPNMSHINKPSTVITWGIINDGEIFLAYLKCAAALW